MIAKGMSESKVIFSTAAHDRLGIQGYVSPGFEAVREAFAENFVRRRELGLQFAPARRRYSVCVFPYFFSPSRLFNCEQFSILPQCEHCCAYRFTLRSRGSP